MYSYLCLFIFGAVQTKYKQVKKYDSTSLKMSGFWCIIMRKFLQKKSECVSEKNKHFS